MFLDFPAVPAFEEMLLVVGLPSAVLLRWERLNGDMTSSSMGAPVTSPHVRLANITNIFECIAVSSSYNIIYIYYIYTVILYNIYRS